MEPPAAVGGGRGRSCCPPRSRDERLSVSFTLRGAKQPCQRPPAEDELESCHMTVSARDRRLAEVLLMAAWTGLRWSESARRGSRDFVRVPRPVLVVSRVAPEGVEAK